MTEENVNTDANKEQPSRRSLVVFAEQDVGVAADMMKRARRDMISLDKMDLAGQASRIEMQLRAFKSDLTSARLDEENDER